MPKGDTDKSQPSTSGHKGAADDGGNQPPTKSAMLSTKVFNDPVHGHIELHPLLVDIIDTPEFQRLRFIKQMGMCYFVYPGASHNRFEHSIGVCHLAGELARHLQSQEEISNEEILCVEIAGLCHDLGHGPFSHLFDKLFQQEASKPPVTHEKLSVAMFKHMLRKKQLKEEFERYKLGEQEIFFIEEMIEGVPKKERKSKIGKNSEKSFFFDIVANKRNGIDVDKWDYLARDSLYLGISNLFDWRRYLKFARVLESGGEKQICTRDKEITNLYGMFHTRYTIHHRACQHKVTRILEDMMAEALIAAKNLPMISVNGGRKKSMLDSIKDMEAYSKLTDNTIWQTFLYAEGTPEISRNLVDRILKRDIYLCIGQTKLTESRMKIKEEDVGKEILNKFMECRKAEEPQNSEEGEKPLEDSDIVVHTAIFSYGMGEEDPVLNVKFYKKDKPDEAVDIDQIIQNSMALPQRFSEKILRVFVKKTGPEMKKTHQLLMQAFDEWCKPKEKSPETSEKKSETTTSTGPAVQRATCQGSLEEVGT